MLTTSKHSAVIVVLLISLCVLFRLHLTNKTIYTKLAYVQSKLNERIGRARSRGAKRAVDEERQAGRVAVGEKAPRQGRVALGEKAQAGRGGTSGGQEPLGEA